MTMPALPADGNTSWGNGGWAAEVDNRVRNAGTATSLSARTIGTGAVEAAAGNHSHAAASETVAGLVELADGTETPAGTDATRAVSPFRLAAELAKKAALRVTTTSQAGTAYTLAVGDANTQVKMSAATAITVTVPSAVFTAGDSVTVRQTGTGQVTLVAGSGVTLNSRGGALKTAGQYAALTITFDTASAAYVDGDATT